MDEFIKYDNFIKNKYYNLYLKIISKSLKEKRNYDTIIQEKHHILPKSLGGSFNISNFCILTFREHYICHFLLTKFSKNKDKMKMCFALHTFFHFNYKNNRPNINNSLMYKIHKKYYIEACKERIPWTKKDIFYFRNRKTNDEFIGTRNEFKKYSGLDSRDMYNLIKQKIRYAYEWGIFLEKENCFSFELPFKYTPLKKILCENCNIIQHPGNYKRWHGDKCKKKL